MKVCTSYLATKGFLIILVFIYSGYVIAGPVKCPKGEERCLDPSSQDPILFYSQEYEKESIWGFKLEDLPIDGEFSTLKKDGIQVWHTQTKTLHLENRKDRPVLFKIQNTDGDSHAFALTTNSTLEKKTPFTFRVIIEPHLTKYLVIPLGKLDSDPTATRLRYTCDNHDYHSGDELKIIS